MLSLIDPGHILFLLSKVAVSEDELQRYTELARSLQDSHRNEVLELLEQQYQEGCRDRLLGIWSNFQGRKAVFLWKLLIMGELDGEKELREALVAAIRRSVDEGFAPRDLGTTWVTFPKKKRPKAGDSWVERIRVNDGQLTLEVRIVKPHKFTDPEGQPEKRLSSTLVTLVLNVNAQVPLLKSFAAASDSRTAVITFIGWLTGKALGKKRGDHLAYVEPITFTKEQMLLLERRLSLENFSITAPDNEGRYTSMTLVSRMELDQYVPFEADDELAQRQRRGNVHKGFFNFRFDHDDGYMEIAQVGFSLRGKHQHLTFPRRLSIPAMEKIIEAVYDQATGRVAAAKPAIAATSGVRRSR
ncbi:hypothetical protein JRI60_01565 [Archangium violaceum]|uniref:hypothetical protein n=1 Tax=Archangium violaceum TaxID=83451 RepID=UPI00194F8BC9|nr:hypothetical protein [Archangium violaceum]QRN97800.1 hypothetical protein JRI60_01565 [Archangium violaceum]